MALVTWRSRDSFTYSEGNTRLGGSRASMRVHPLAHREVGVSPPPMTTQVELWCYVWPSAKRSLLTRPEFEDECSRTPGDREVVVGSREQSLTEFPEAMRSRQNF